MILNSGGLDSTQITT
jgi:hypothetical protein